MSQERLDGVFVRVRTQWKSRAGHHFRRAGVTANLRQCGVLHLHLNPVIHVQTPVPRELFGLSRPIQRCPNFCAHVT